MAPEYWNVFSFVSQISSRRTRNSDSGILYLPKFRYEYLKSLGPIDRKFHGHGENDGFVLYGYIIKQFSSFCKYTNISVMKKSKKKVTCQQ